MLFRNEYFLADYIYKIGNFSVDYINTGFIGEGYTDVFNANWSSGIDSLPGYKEGRQSFGTHEDGVSTYDFCVIPLVGFLGNNDPLPKNTEVKLSFDRTNNAIPIIAAAEPDSINLEIKDCYAVTEYISSPELRSYFDGIDNHPIRYEYEECEEYTKSIPQGETNIRFDNLRGGNVPSHMFIGLTETASLNGDFTKSSTNFGPKEVSRMNITLDGNSVNGYPIIVANQRCTIPLTRFIDCTNQLQNTNAGQQLKPFEFNYNWLWSHCFEAEESSRGWIGVDFKVDTAFTTPMTMVVWVISQTGLQIDKFHQIEKYSY